MKFLNGARLKRITDRSPKFLLWRGRQLLWVQLQRLTWKWENRLVSERTVRALFSGEDSIQRYLNERTSPRFFLTEDEVDEVIAWLSQKDVSYRTRVTEKADRLCKNILPILGHGPMNVGKEIDWLRDYSSGLRWPQAYAYDIDFIDPDRPSDVRSVWELNRLHFLVFLGKAFRVTGDDRFVFKLMSLFNSWQRENPVGYSVNWIYSINVAIRAISMIWAIQLCLRSRALTERFLIHYLGSLISHGRYIIRNLEYSDRRGNHYLANVVGLIYLGIYLHEYPEAQKWLKYGIDALETEMRLQVLDDGASYEKSVSYHRFVTEMFLSALLMLERNGYHLSVTFKTKLERMLEFVHGYLMPDGTAPLFGDNDEARVHWLGEQSINDHRYLLATGAAYFQRSDFKRIAGRFWEESAWLLGMAGIKRFDQLEAPADYEKTNQSAAFHSGGFFVMRHGSSHLMVDCGDIGMGGRGGHGHADTLSFTLVMHGEQILVDPGSSKYTADWDMRIWTTGSAAHNVILIDGEERAPRRPYGLRTLTNIPAELIGWESDIEEDRFEGAQYGYQRLTQPVEHLRMIRFKKEENKFRIVDELRGDGHHKIESMLHFSPELTVVANDHCFQCQSRETGRQYRIQVAGHDSLQLKQCPVYRRYGVSELAYVGTIFLKTRLPATLKMTIDAC